MADAPVLETPNLRLLPFADAHLTDTYIGWLGDAEVTRYSEQRHRSHDRASCAAFVASFTGTPSMLWAIETRDGRHLGNLHADVDAANAVADLAIMLGERDARGRGLGLEAWRAVLDHLLGPGRMRKVTAGCMAVNAPMLALMEKSGMTVEGRLTRQFLWRGREVDLVKACKFRHG